MCYALGNANSKDTRIGLENVNFGIFWEIKKWQKSFTAIKVQNNG